MGKKMSKAPVYYTIAQVQFNPILNLESYLPEIQSKMRGMHFPDYLHEVSQLINSAGNHAVIPLASVPQQRFFFGDIQNQTQFLLSASSLSLQTTNYDSFEAFSKTLRQGLDIVHQALSLAYIDRIGLRYVDAVMPINKDDLLSNYLATEVFGLSEKLKGKLSHSVSETMMHIDNGHLVSRLIIQDGVIGLPMDAAMASIKIQDRFAQYNGRYAIIDTDAVFQHREVFCLDKIKNILDTLHMEIESAFQITITEHAQKMWA